MELELASDHVVHFFHVVTYFCHEGAELEDVFDSAGVFQGSFLCGGVFGEGFVLWWDYARVDEGVGVVLLDASGPVGRGVG